MGFAVAAAARDRGARVTLVHGRTDVYPPEGVTAVAADTVEKMRKAVLQAFPRTDLVVMAAAVSDYKVRKTATDKIKKTTALRLDLVPAPDILQELGKRKKKQVLVGFALETRDEMAQAAKKLKAKNLDLVVVNNPQVPGAGFGTDTNVVTILNRWKKSEALPKLTKREVADAILDRAVPRLKGKTSTK
jgi:phosphopantothenoylcysteine decarboxylase/phosphopantothenate--cysteine ligase